MQKQPTLNSIRAFMKAKEISNLYWFCQAIEHGGFAPASLYARVSAPTLSRAVSHLEEALGEKLLHRNAKQFRLTTAGEEYYRRFAPIFQQLGDQWEQLSNLQPALKGDIRVSCPEPFADSFLQPLAIEFMTTHPGVNVHIELSSDTEKFFDDRIDLAISTNPPKAPHLVQRKLLDMELSLAAAPSYLDKMGRPSEIEGLANHDLLAGNRIPAWEFHQDGEKLRIPIKPKYSVDSLRLIIQAACEGIGICLIPSVILAPLLASNRLEALLPEVECPTGKVYMVWADRNLVASRVSAFREMIFERMSEPHKFLASISLNSR